jgi:hypothetical protein
MKQPIEKYRVIREIPRSFVNLLPIECPPIQAGEVCHYFEPGDIYLFEARKGYVPWTKRKTVELWYTMFEPFADTDHGHGHVFNNAEP